MKLTIAKAMQKVLGEKPDELATETGFVKRHREISGASFVKGLVFGWMNAPSASLSTLSQSLGNVGSPIKRQSLANRFQAETAHFLKAVLAAALESQYSSLSCSESALKSLYKCGISR